MEKFQYGLFIRTKPYFASSIESGFKELIETKHLYQSLRIETPDRSIVQQEMKKYISGAAEGNPELAETIEFIHSSLSNMEWVINDPHGMKSLNQGGAPSQLIYVSTQFTPPTVKLFCGICNRTEAFNFHGGHDLLNDSREPNKIMEPVSEQIFFLAYQCQSCKSTPEIFMIRRNNLKLIQSGRTPIEEIELPSYLPKKQKKYISDATIAFNSGQSLAGNFLLRVFIEQYIRSLSSTPDSQNIDALFLEYSKGLPDDFKQRFPSLQSVYDKLSEDLHLATASEKIFLQSRSNIEKHFKAKEVFEL
ncbi:MAG: hypothetical protein ABSB41_19905 [Anaerolineales bacterium]|jgi:hypothetical protein